MNIEIKKLSIELIDDYLHFFDYTLHSTGIDEHKCYCVCWTSTSANFEGCSTAEKRRSIAKEYIERNYIQGYLAYYNGKVIGWCNTNIKKDCYNCISWQMFMKEVKKDEKIIKSVFCFEIAPEYRNKGIATKLLERVCTDAEKDGFDCVESYPNIEFIDTEQDFMGPVMLYKKCGFTIMYKLKDKYVMRKNFTKDI